MAASLAGGAFLALTLAFAPSGEAKADPIHTIQLGLYQKTGVAWWAWKSVQQRQPDLAARLTPFVDPLDPDKPDGDVALRAFVAGDTDITGFCRKMAGAGLGCIEIEIPLARRDPAQQRGKAVASAPVAPAPAPAASPAVAAAPAIPPAPAMALAPAIVPTTPPVTIQTTTTPAIARAEPAPPIVIPQRKPPLPVEPIPIPAVKPPLPGAADTHPPVSPQTAGVAVAAAPAIVPAPTPAPAPAIIAAPVAPPPSVPLVPPSATPAGSAAAVDTAQTALTNGHAAAPVAPQVAAQPATVGEPPARPPVTAPPNAETKSEPPLFGPPVPEQGNVNIPALALSAIMPSLTTEGTVTYRPDEAQTMSDVEQRARRQGRLGAVLPHSGMKITPAVLNNNGINYCAITLDDGPSRTVTRHILDIINEEKIKVTYFPIGKPSEVNGPIISDIVASGHEVGNHSLTHIDLRKATPEVQRYEIEETNRILRSFGANPVLFRPPYGRYNDSLIRIARELGMATVLWNVDTRDWQSRDPDKIVQQVETSAGTGSVVLLHSTYPSTAAALPRVIADMRAKGCQFMTLSQWIEHMRVAAAPAPSSPTLVNHAAN